MTMKMTSTMVCENPPAQWANVAKALAGVFDKEDCALHTKQKKKKFNAKVPEFVPKKKAANAPTIKHQFSFNPEAPEFSAPELKMNPLAEEFAPPVTQGLKPAMKEFVPTGHKLMSKAAEMQRLLLECYTDDETTDDEPQCPPSAPVMQKLKQATKRGTTMVVPFRPPPGLAPPEASLNPFAEAFDPSTCFADGKVCSPAPALTSAINFAGFFSEDEDEVLVSKPVELSKVDQASIHDSTSAGESSDSDTESWSGLL